MVLFCKYCITSDNDSKAIGRTYSVTEVLRAYFEFWHWAGCVGCWASFGLVLIGHCAGFVAQTWQP